MESSLKNLNIAELNLDLPAYELVQRLLNHIEIIISDLNDVQEENQQLRDEIARLKGEKGKPKIKPNRSDEQEIKVTPDGTTAATRLFDSEFPDLFSWLLDKMDELPLPRKSRERIVSNPLTLSGVPC